MKQLSQKLKRERESNLMKDLPLRVGLLLLPVSWEMEEWWSLEA